MAYETCGNQAQRQSRLSAMQEGIDILHKQVSALQQMADDLVGMLPPAVEKSPQCQKIEENTMATMVSNFPTVSRLLAERIATVEARIRDAFL